MDLPLDIKEEPVWLDEPPETSLDGTGSTENVEIKQEISVMSLPKVEEEEMSSFGTEKCTPEVLKEAESTGCDSKESSLNIVKESVMDNVSLRADNDGRDSLKQALHSLERRFCCALCGKCFADRRTLQTHVFLHSRERRHVCSTCNKGFFRASDLKCHEVVHTKERPYICTICRKSFAFSSNLRVHMAIHLNEKPFPCDFCGKSFTQASHLKGHLNTHSNSGFHVCNTCGKRYSTRANLKNHMLLHGEKKFDCPLCPKKFIRSFDLTTHMKLHSKNSVNPSETGNI